MALRTSDHCPGCRALVSGDRAQGHTEECRIRVEGELRKTEEGKARRRAAASRVGDAPTGRALKRFRFAADRVEDDAEENGGEGKFDLQKAKSTTMLGCWSPHQYQRRQLSLLKPHRPAL